MDYKTIKRNYERGLWNKKMVATAVKKGLITEAQYREITGDEYKGA
jgi:hypothetical protein